MIMNINRPITQEYFIKRLGDLCLKSGMAGFPKDETDQHILLKSVMVMIGQAGSLTEKEINEKLEVWVRQVCQTKEIDRVSLRRRLVDTGYLARSKDGASYQVAVPGPQPGLFDASIDQLDILQIITAAREELARRKQEYMAKARGA